MAVNVLGAVVALGVINKLGRKTLLLTSASVYLGTMHSAARRLQCFKTPQGDFRLKNFEKFFSSGNDQKRLKNRKKLKKNFRNFRGF